MRDMEFLNIANEKSLDWLKRQKLRWVNTYSWSGAVDKAGWPYLVVGWNDRPDSDWGKYEARGILRAKSRELLAQAEVILMQKLGHEGEGFLRDSLPKEQAA